MPCQDLRRQAGQLVQVWGLFPALLPVCSEALGRAPLLPGTQPAELSIEDNSWPVVSRVLGRK